MEEVFRSFCVFGGERTSVQATMDGAKLAKLCRDLKLLDNNLKATDVDIVFSKVKAKSEYADCYRYYTYRPIQYMLVAWHSGN